MRGRAAGGWLLVALAAAGCGAAGAGRRLVVADSARINARATRLAATLARPDSGKDRERPLALWVVPVGLSEISGLALTADQRLLAHDDERGAVSEIDYRRGVVTKQFLLGKPHTVHADFEGITVAGDKIFLLASNGILYEFKEGGTGERVDYTVHDTHLGKECEFEGVAFDPAIGSLLLACKHVFSKALQNFLVIYRWKLEPGDSGQLSQLTVPLDQATGSNGWKAIHPSDITIDPLNGNYVIIASQQKALIEITPAGVVLLSRPLPGDHDMAEGVAITRDSILIISDESAKRPAVVTLYRWPL
ncbi:MAG TPA: SdiA-regulated domain-containing protein [Gemmatimonadales bacterium]|nr:SdiA-regulated domain-containing protein [Gemmatimonadales bacterium]